MRLNVHLPEELVARLQQHRIDTGIPINRQVEDALRAALKMPRKPSPRRKS